MNLATTFSMAYRDYGEQDVNRFPTSLMIEWIYRGELELARKLELPRATANDSAVDDTATYDYPTGILDTMVLRVLNGAATTSRSGLIEKTIEDIRTQDDNWENADESTPKWWYKDFVNAKIGLYPPPDTDVTDGIKFVYVQAPTKMSTYYTTGTVVTAATDKTITGTSTVFTNVAAGDAFALGKLLDNPDSDSFVAFPTTWYTIDSVTDATHLELTAAYPTTNTSAMNYIICDKSTFDTSYESVTESTVYYVLMRMAEKDGNADKYGLYKSKWLERINYYKALYARKTDNQAGFYGEN